MKNSTGDDAHDVAIASAYLAAEMLEGGMEFEAAVRLLYGINRAMLEAYDRLKEAQTKRPTGLVVPSDN